MVDWFATVVMVAALLAAAWSGVLVARNRRPGWPVLAAVAIVEALLLAQAVIAVVTLATDRRPDELATFIGYLVASLLVLPAGVAWALSERSRSATAVLVVACLVIPVVVLRMQQVWDGTGA